MSARVVSSLRRRWRFVWEMVVLADKLNYWARELSCTPTNLYVSYVIFPQLSNGDLGFSIGGWAEGQKRVFLLKSSTTAIFKMAAEKISTSNESPIFALHNDMIVTSGFIANFLNTAWYKGHVLLKNRLYSKLLRSSTTEGSTNWSYGAWLSHFLGTLNQLITLISIFKDLVSMAAPFQRELLQEKCLNNQIKS